MRQPSVDDDARPGVTADQVYDLIHRTQTLEVSAGCELVERDLTVVEDISDSVWDATVTRHSYAIMHAKLDMTLGNNLELDWGTSLVRPYYLMNGVRFNLGCYFTNAPRESAGNPIAVNGIDILDALYDPVGTSFTMAKDAGFLDTIEDILLAKGFVTGTYIIDPRDRFKTTSKARTWLMINYEDPNNMTWLKICNELCNMIGYRGLWSDWNGRIRVEPYQPPWRRQIEWELDATDPTTNIIGRARSVTTNTYKVPNRWVVYRTNLFDANGTPIAPVPGAGSFEWTNKSAGPTSVDARGGRVITKVVGVESADQDALVRRTRSIADGDMQLTTKVEVETGPIPLFWHFDKIRVNDPDNMSGEMLVTGWNLPFNGEIMGQEWTVIHGSTDDLSTEEELLE